MHLQEYIRKYGNVVIEEKALNELLGIKESKIWKPQCGDSYYLILSDGEVTQTVWYGDKNVYDNRNWLMGNVYQTEEEAKFAAEKRRVEVELQRFAAEHNEYKINWNNFYQNKYYFYYSHINKKIQVTSDCVTECSQVHFTSREIAQEAIETIGADRIKKYYFGVTDQKEK